MVAVALGVERFVEAPLWRLLVSGALACLAYAAVVFPLRHEVLGLLKRSNA